MGQQIADRRRASPWAIGGFVLSLLVAACGGGGPGFSATPPPPSEPPFLPSATPLGVTATPPAPSELPFLPSVTPFVPTATPLPQRATQTPIGTQAFAGATPWASHTPTPTGDSQRPGPVTQAFSLPQDLRPLAPGDFNHLSPLAALRFMTGDPQRMAIAASPDGRLPAA